MAPRLHKTVMEDTNIQTADPLCTAGGRYGFASSDHVTARDAQALRTSPPPVKVSGHHKHRRNMQARNGYRVTATKDTVVGYVPQGK